MSPLWSAVLSHHKAMEQALWIRINLQGQIESWELCTGSVSRQISDGLTLICIVRGGVKRCVVGNMCWTSHSRRKSGASSSLSSHPPLFPLYPSPSLCVLVLPLPPTSPPPWWLSLSALFMSLHSLHHSFFSQLFLLCFLSVLFIYYFLMSFLVLSFNITSLHFPFLHLWFHS